jgi:hypothetical protein
MNDVTISWQGIDFLAFEIGLEWFILGCSILDSANFAKWRGELLITKADVEIFETSKALKLIFYFSLCWRYFPLFLV